MNNIIENLKVISSIWLLKLSNMAENCSVLTLNLKIFLYFLQT